MKQSKPIIGVRMPDSTQTHLGSWMISALAYLATLGAGLITSTQAAEPAKNLFHNPSFELGQEGWRADKAGKTECRFTVDDQDAAFGRYSARLDMGKVEEWGVQFGQSFPAGQKGKTFTFAALAKSLKGPTQAWLAIERSAKPWDKAVSREFKLTDQWQELHVTFQVDKDFSQGWFAYLMCTQPQAGLRVDMFRLHEGAYVPYKDIAQQETAVVAVRTFDTRKPLAAAQVGEALSRRGGWSELPEDKVDHKFAGDGVILNDRVALVLRRGARGAEVYSLEATGAARRTVLSPATGTAQATLASFALVENNPGAGSADAVFKTADGKTLALRYELKVGQPVVQTEARGGVKALRVEAPCRFAVLPDFFADDIVMDAAELPVAQAELPSDNFLLHLLPGGDAIVMTVTKTSEEDIRVALSGAGEQRRIDGSEIHYGKDGKVWVAVLAGPSIWHTRNIAPADAGQVVRLDWKAPFPAQWRIDWRRAENLSDSWDMLAERPDGSFVRHGIYGGPETLPPDRKRWTTVIGTFKYPCWLDQQGQGFLQPLKSNALRFQGPAVIYPINRIPASSLDTFTVVDIVRNTLGVGPCEYVLDVEGQRSQSRGRATCAVRDTLNPIYSQNQQRQRRADIERTLEDLMLFVRYIRGRIEGYVAFGHEILDYLAAQRKAHPELSDRLGELEAVARVMDAKFAARREKIKTPDQAAEMVKEFRQAVLEDYSAEALAKCKRYTEGWVSIGGNQDELVGECRWVIKMLRQRAGLMMATDPRLAEVAKEIRQRSQVILRNPAGHEGARH